MMEFDEILTEAVRHDASDVLIKVGVPPAFRIHSDFLPLEQAEALDPLTIESYARQVTTDPQWERLKNERQLDTAYDHPDLGRFRLNVFRQRGTLSIVIRVIPAQIRSVAELTLPPVIEGLTAERRGLILVTGTTGSGKSTTLAAIIDHINRTRQAHIITIEDPIEYVHRDRLSFVNQREIGDDALDFPSALKSALRQNPDVILVGEMRDLTTIETAITAAETGHLVMSTLHTLDARETVTRVISAFPEHQRDQARLILANILRGVVSQRLIPRADGSGMVPAVEVMVASARVAEHIADKVKTRDLHEVIAQGYTTYGMQTFDQSLMYLFRNGLITFEEAMANCTNPNDFELKIRGIASTSDARWENFDDGARDDGERNGRIDLDIERF
jgi:twitching motility protein PilT